MARLSGSEGIEALIQTLDEYAELTDEAVDEILSEQANIVAEEQRLAASQLFVKTDKKGRRYSTGQTGKSITVGKPTGKSGERKVKVAFRGARKGGKRNAFVAFLNEFGGGKYRAANHFISVANVKAQSRWADSLNNKWSQKMASKTNIIK